MATLESILRLKDSFTNTIDRITKSMDNVAKGGASAAASINASMDKNIANMNEYSTAMQNAQNITVSSSGIIGTVLGGIKNHYTDLFQRQKEMNDSINAANPSQLELLEQKYQNILEEIELSSTKLNAQSSLHNAWVDKVKQLQTEYSKLNKASDTEGAKQALDELNKAKINMANLGLSTRTTLSSIEKLREREKAVSVEIVKCEKEQKLFNQILQKARGIAESVNNAISPIGNTISGLRQKIHNVIDSAKAKMNSGMGSGFGGYIKAFLGIAALKKAFDGTIGSGAKLSQQMNSMIGMLGDEAIGRSYFARLQDYASASGQSISDLTAITQQFLSTTKNTDQLMSLNKIAEKLAFRNQSQGLEGAGYALNEALSGQFQSLKTRFNLSSAQIEPIKKAIAAGNFEGVTAAFNDSLAQAGITDQVIEGFRKSVPNQVTGILNDLKTSFSTVGMGALENIQPLLTQIRDWLDSSGAQQFFGIIGNGLSMITQGITWIGQKFAENWSIIQPILIGLAVAAAVTGAVMLASWILSMLPLFALIAILAVAVKKLQQMGIKSEEIAEFIGGIFGVMASTVGNVFIGIWNLVVDVAEFLTNVFIDPAYAIKKLFYDLTIDVLKFFDGMIQGIVSSINWVIDKINQVTKSDMKKVEVNFVSSWIDNLESKRDALSSDKNVVDFSSLKMEYINGTDAFNKGAQAGTKLFNTVSDSIDSFKMNESAWNASQVSALDGIKDDTDKIKNSVDIGNEQLKYLRDIAEREAINKFTNTTLVPQLAVSFGDVRETADVDKVLDKLTEIVEEALYTGEEGVHA